MVAVAILVGAEGVLLDDTAVADALCDLDGVLGDLYTSLTKVAVILSFNVCP